MTNLKETTEQLRRLNDKLARKYETTIQVQAIRREHSTERQALREATNELRLWREYVASKKDMQRGAPVAAGVSDTK